MLKVDVATATGKSKLDNRCVCKSTPTMLHFWSLHITNVMLAKKIMMRGFEINLTIFGCPKELKLQYTLKNMDLKATSVGVQILVSKLLCDKMCMDIALSTKHLSAHCYVSTHSYLSTHSSLV